MSSHSREKIALLVFTALIVLSLLGLGWYIFAGHSWNVAASNIDDTVGNMSGYTAIVYAGTQESEKSASTDESSASSSKDAASGSAANASASTTSDTATTSDGATTSDAETTSEGATTSDTATISDTATTSEGVTASKPASSTPSSNSSSATADVADDAVSGASEKDGSSSSASSSSGILGGFPFSSQKKEITVEEAQTSYEEKQATVFTLDTTNLGRYTEGTILKKGSHRFGVFSVVKPLSSIEIEKKVAYFKRLNVDFIVALVPDSTYLEGVPGIDIVISTQDEDLFVMGETKNGTFYVDAPVVGRVGAILISPSNVVSAKVLEAQ